MCRKAGSIPFCLLVLSFLLPSARVTAREILLIDDSAGGFGPVAGLLTAEGHTVTELTDELAAGYSNVSDAAFLADFDMVIFAVRDFFGAVPPVAANSAMETYIRNGGDLLITGVTGVIGSADLVGRSFPDLARVLGPEVGFSVPDTDQTVTNIDNYITNGPHGDFRGATIANSDGFEQLFANTGLGTVSLVQAAGGQPDKIIFTDLPGAGGSVGAWQGSGGGAAQPDFFDGGTFQGMLLNWAEGGTTTQTEVTPRVFSTALHPEDSFVSMDLYIGDPNNGGALAGSVGPINIEGTMDIVGALDGSGNGTLAITNSSVGVIDALNQLVDLGILGTLQLDVEVLDLYFANQTVGVAANSYDLSASPYYVAGFTGGEFTIHSPTGALEGFLDGVVPFFADMFYGGPDDLDSSVLEGTFDEGVGLFTNLAELNLNYDDFALPIFDVDGLGEIWGVLNGEIHVAEAPEPSSLVLGGIAAVGFWVAHRRRKPAKRNR